MIATSPVRVQTSENSQSPSSPPTTLSPAGYKDVRSLGVTSNGKISGTAVGNSGETKVEVDSSGAVGERRWMQMGNTLWSPCDPPRTRTCERNREGACTVLSPTVHSQEALMLKFTNIALVAALGLGVAACGNNPTDRALTGGAIGAGTGAVVGSTMGAPLAGAVVGGLGGAAIGAATTPRNDYGYYR